MDYEKLLPSSDRIDVFLGEYCTDVQQEIEERRLGDNEVLDPSVELYDLKSFEYFSYFIKGEVLQSEDAEVRKAVYRALVFGYEVTQIIHEANAQFDAVPYIRHIIASEDRERQLREDTQYYLADNPHIHDLIQYYIEAIDEGRGVHELIEMAAALMFMLVERNLGNTFVHETARNATVDQFFDERE